jgi:hypothetical protein
MCTGHGHQGIKFHNGIAWHVSALVLILRSPLSLLAPHQKRLSIRATLGDRYKRRMRTHAYTCEHTHANTQCMGSMCNVYSKHTWGGGALRRRMTCVPDMETRVLLISTESLGVCLVWYPLLEAIPSLLDQHHQHCLGACTPRGPL